MRNKLRFFALTIFMVASSGCSYLESLFPDKERDYQYTTETPLLNWPSGLRQNKTGSSSGDAPSASDETKSTESADNGQSVAPPSADSSSSENSSSEEAASSTSPDVQATEVTPADESDAQESVSSIEIVKYDDGESRLRLGAGFAKSWRLVNKALTHNAIEVTERNHDQGLVTIHYDPDEKKAKDDSFTDEIDFLFKGININDKEYNLKFEEHEQKTDLIVLDDEHLPLLNDNSALRLLKLLSDTIKTDLVKKEK